MNRRGFLGGSIGGAVAALLGVKLPVPAAPPGMGAQGLLFAMRSDFGTTLIDGSKIVAGSIRADYYTVAGHVIDVTDVSELRNRLEPWPTDLRFGAEIALPGGGDCNITECDFERHIS